jgi:hypothetical protein
MENGRNLMTERDDDSRTQLSAWIPKEVHRQAKILATVQDIDLQDLVANALQAYLTDSGLSGVVGRLSTTSGRDSTSARKHSNR